MTFRVGRWVILTQGLDLVQILYKHKILGLSKVLVIARYLFMTEPKFLFFSLYSETGALNTCPKFNNRNK